MPLTAPPGPPPMREAAAISPNSSNSPNPTPNPLPHPPSLYLDFHQLPHPAAEEPDYDSTIVPATPPDPLPGVIPALGITMLAGAPRAGKTVFLASIAKALAKGLPIFGRQPSPVSKVVWVNAGLSYNRTTRHWFTLLGYPEIVHYCLQDDFKFDKSRLRNKFHRTAILRECLDKLKQSGNLPWGSVVFVDMLTLFLGGSLLDYDACMVACSEIRAHCHELGVTIIGTAHASKQKADPKQRYSNIQDRVAGSIALMGFTDTQMYLATPQEVEGKFHALLWHPRHAPAEVFELAQDDHGLFNAVAAGGSSTLPTTGPTEAQKSLLTLIPLQNDPAGPGYVRIAALTTLAQAEWGMSRPTIYRYLDQLEAAGLVVKVDRGKFAQRVPVNVGESPKAVEAVQAVQEAPPAPSPSLVGDEAEGGAEGLEEGWGED